MISPRSRFTKALAEAAVSTPPSILLVLLEQVGDDVLRRDANGADRKQHHQAGEAGVGPQKNSVSSVSLWFVLLVGRAGLTCRTMCFSLQNK